MKRRQRTIQEDTLLVGIDIGMERNTAYCTNIVDGTKTIIFTHTREGYEAYEYVATIKGSSCTGCLVGYEPTGTRRTPLIHYLIHKGRLLSR